MQKRNSGIANVTGWIAANGARRDPRIGEVAEREEPCDPIVGRGDAGPARTPGARPATPPRSARTRARAATARASTNGASRREERIGMAAEPHHLLARGAVRRSRAAGPATCSRRPAPCSRGRTARSRKVTKRRGRAAKSTAVHPTIAAATTSSHVRCERARPTRPSRPAASPSSSSCGPHRQAEGRAAADGSAPGDRTARSTTATVATATASVHTVSNGVG